jgi:hypothetical protein
MKGVSALIVLLLAVPFVSASYISLQVGGEINETAGNITVTHLGDEPAYQVQVVSRVRDQVRESAIRDRLSVGESMSAAFSLNRSDKNPGMYPLLATVHYQDANGYLFSALHARFVKYILATRSEIVVELGDAEIKDEVRVPVMVKNFGETSRNARVYLFISNEFVVSENNKSIVVQPKSTEKLEFAIDNFGARPGSNYVFYAVAEYDEQEQHYGSLDSGVLKVLLEKNRFFDTKGILIALVIIVLVIIVLQFTRKK